LCRAVPRQVQALIFSEAPIRVEPASIHDWGHVLEPLGPSLERIGAAHPTASIPASS
jgi:hypothetical protein